MDKNYLSKINNTREALNNLVAKNLNELTNLEIVTLSKELDKLIVVYQKELNKKNMILH
ncbi:aspartyl-phosphate phosphatase Spo0E family protein [Senegalia massiliensis]|uniref:Aspartyl-phosphate phosphatase Spo0E family protein n=1 Tax=Senegalia massiliensis TaxID=1720316 RepID=A0A845R087_9CLOT|nr:aspartyl-phosphate phosphatase Spo0E family protein [Senegalia massiliensis]NBI07409.1 aspartyl-phosphate phosphatase Spo0E family protein [Senegalia massiliensis]